MLLGMWTPTATTAVDVEAVFGAAKDGYDIAQEIQGAEGLAGEEPGLLDVAAIYYDLGKAIYENRENLGRTFKNLGHELASLLGTTFSYEANGFKIVTTPTYSGLAFVVVGYDNINGFSNLNVRIPDTVITKDPDTGEESSAPIVAILKISSAEKIVSLNIGSVTAIAPHALDIATLTNFTAGTSHFNSIDGVLFNGDHTILLRFPPGLGGNYVVPSSVKRIEDGAFYKCTQLSSLTIGSNVTQIGADAFANSGLQNVYFGGNPPQVSTNAFRGDPNCRVYYLPGFTGWGTTGKPIAFGGTMAELYNPFTSTVVGNSTVTITQFAGWGNPASAAVLVPSVINGLPVTAIGASAFSYQLGATNVVVPDSVISIGDYAFEHCLDLKTIQLSANLTSLGENAFIYCTNLTRLSIPNGVTIIPDGMAASCTSLGTVSIGSNVTSIGYGAFNSCGSLFFLRLPATLTSIGQTAFDYCGSVRIEVDPSNTRWSNDRNGALFNKTQTELIHANSQPAGSYYVPDTVVNIDDTAFFGANFSAVFVPAGVTTLGANAFANCSNLAAVYFAGTPPTTPTAISQLAFSGNTNVVYRLSNMAGWQATYGGAAVKDWVVFGAVTNNNSITLTSYTGPGGNVVLPSTFNGAPVTAIQAGIFQNKGAISSLQLPDSVTNIADSAFAGLINLTNLIIGNNVTNIGNSAFAGCTSLASLIIPDSVKSIGTAAFSGCGIATLAIGSGLTSLSDNLFSDCQLQSLTIPPTVIHIGSSTFANNKQLGFVTIAGSVTSLGANAFANCIHLAHAYFQGDAPATDGTAFNGDYNAQYANSLNAFENNQYRTVVQYLPGTTGWGSSYGGVPAEVLPIDYTISGIGPNRSITITRFAISGFLPLPSSINGIPVTGIADRALANNPGLTGVLIPSGITSIGDSPFMNCTNLTNLVVASGNSSYTAVSNVLFNSSRTVLKQFPGGLGGSYTVPSTVTNIGTAAFYGSALKQAVIQSSVKIIGAEAFSFCRALTNLSVASGNTIYSSSGGVLFNAARTTLLQYPGGLGGTYAVPTTVTTLGPSAFAASGITSVVIPPNTAVIPAGALAYCGKLTNITVQAGNVTFASVNGVLEDVSRTTLLQYPGGLVGDYKAAYVSGVIPDFAISNNITAIGSLAFAGGSLRSVTIPAGVGSIGGKAFADCSALGWANFFGNAPSNDGTAFTNSSSARVFYLASGSGFGSSYGGATAKEIPLYIQDNGNNTLTLTGYHGTAPSFFVLPEDIFGETVSSIGNNAFASQTNISDLGIPSTVTNIGDSAFSGCIRVDNVILRNSGSLTLGHDAFAGCLSLKKMIFSAAPATIGYQAFIGCSSLNDVSFGGVTTIGDHAFYGTALKAVFLGDSVRSVEAYAFANYGIYQVILPAALTNLGSHAFANIGSPAGRASVYAYGNPPASDGTVFANGYANIFFLPGNSWPATYNGAQTLVIPAHFTYTIGLSGATITGIVDGYRSLIVPPVVYGQYSSRPIPVVAISSGAFAGNLILTNVTFPESLVSIGDAAFRNCSNLLSAPLPASVTSIGTAAFQNCVKLHGINISQNVTNIGANAFAGCPGETTLDFGAGLAYLGTNAFSGWTNLQTIYFEGNAPATNSSGPGPFAGDANAALFVLPGSIGWGTNYFGNAVSQWTQYYYNLATNGVPIGQNNSSILYGPGLSSPSFNTNGATNVEVILQGYAGSQTVVTVPSSINGWPVTTLYNTFYDKRDIRSVILPNSITNMIGDVFKYCGLTNIVLSTNLLRITGFYGSALQSVVIPDSITSVDSSAFYLSALTNVVLPRHLLSIGDYAFSLCPLQTISLPPTLQTIGNHAFDSFPFGNGLTNIVFPASLTSIGDRAFADCPIAGKILIPPAVSYIGDGAFDWIRNAPGEIYFEGNAPASDGTPFSGVSSYGVVNGFRYSTGPGIAYYDRSTFGWGASYSGMKTAPWNPYTYTINGNTVTITGYLGSGGALRVPSSVGGYPVTAIGANAFASNSSLSQITLPSSITSLGTSAFAASTNLAAIYFNGNAPVAGSNIFSGDNLQVYHLDSLSGWTNTYSGVNVVAYPATGAITITINPGNIGAQWRVDGGTNYYPSGATATNLLVGTHVVSFSTVGGNWQTPNNLNLQVGAFQGTLFTMPYTYIPFNYVTNGTNLTITGYSGTGGVVYLPDAINGLRVTGIAANAFANSSITGIVLPDNITSVGTNAFAGCSNLVSVTVGSGITNLAGNVFKNCPNLLSVFFDGNAPVTDGTIFTGDAIATVYHLTAGTGWSNSYSGRSVSVIPYTFSVLGGNTVRITGYSGPGGTLAIPGRIGGLPVTDIYSSVFQNNLSLTNVTIPDSVVSIEFQAFAGCSNLQTVALGTNLQWIGPLAFINCTALTNINFPDSLQQIYQGAFQNNQKLSGINLGQGLTWIDSGAFSQCTNLSQVTLGSSLTNIGSSAFSFCGALTNLTFPDGLATIQSSAFSSCTNLTSVEFGTNLSVIGDGAFANCNFRSLVFPPNIYLGTNAFFACRQLTNVLFTGMMQFISTPLVDTFYLDTLAVVYYPSAAVGGLWRSPDRATSDYRAAVAYSLVSGSSDATVRIDHFAGGGNFAIPPTLGGHPVTSLASNALASYIDNLVIPAGLVDIGIPLFATPGGDSGVNTITVDAANPNYTVTGGVLFNKDQTTLIRYPNFLNSLGNYNVPSSVTSIADYAFSSCSLAGVTLPPNLFSIGNGAFFGAGVLATVSSPAPDSLTSLGQSAFEGATALTNFITGNSLASLQSRTFANCTQLKSVTLGQSVGSIGQGAFSNCVNLASIAFPSGLGSIGDGAFARCQSLVTLTLPTGVPAGTNYYSLQLGSGVFAACTGLQSAYFLGNRPNPDYGNTFAGDSQLTVYFLTNSLGWSANFGGAAATSYAPFGSLQVSFAPNLAGQAWRVDGGAWVTNDTGLPVVTQLPAGSHTLSFAAVNNFYTPSNQVLVVSNMSLTSFTAHYVQTPISYTANGNFLTVVGGQLNADGFLVIPPTINGLPVTSIGGGAFANNQSLIGVIMPSTITNVGDSAFFNCTNLAHVIFSTNLLSIGNSAFFLCKNLQSVVIPDSVTNLNQGAFANCTRLSSVQIGSGITSIVGNSTFNGDHQLYTLFFNGAPPSDIPFLTNSYHEVAVIYYNPAAAGWGGVTVATPTPWPSLFSYATNNGGGITITGFQGGYYYPSIIVPPKISGLPVTAIGDRAFQYLNPLVLLPATVSSFGESAFSQSSAAVLFIGSSVTNIARDAFKQCGNLSSLFVHPANPNYSDINGILYNKTQTELIAAGGRWGWNNTGALLSLTVPNGVTAIDEYALSSLQNVYRIDLPASLATIGESALSDSYYLTNITVDPSNPFFFTRNSSLFNKSGTILIQYFGGHDIPHYTIPAGVQSIGGGAFSAYYELESLIMPPSVVNIGSNAFFECGFKSLNIPNAVTNIGSSAFMYSSLTNIVLPAGLKSISSYLFYNCQSLISVVIPPGVTNIGEFAFAASTITAITLPTSLIHLGVEAFSSSHLTSVVIPNQVIDIGVNAFTACYYLNNVTIGAGVTNIGAGAFIYDNSLYKATFLGNAPSTDGNIFGGSTTVYRHSGTTGWSGSFAGASSVIDYESTFDYTTNPDGTLTIVGCNFHDYDVRLPSQANGKLVTGIASNAFDGVSFYNVTIPAGITNIAPDAFIYSSIGNFIVEPGNPACISVAGSLYNTTLTRLFAPADKSSFTLPSTATNVLLSTFESCYYIESISVDPGNPRYSGVGGVLFNKQATLLLLYPRGNAAGGYSVPETVTTIGTNAFSGIGLGGIRIPASVTNIQANALAYNYFLSAYFEGAAPVIDSTAFAGDSHAILFYLPPTTATGFLPAGLPVQSWLSLFTWTTNNGNSISVVGYNDPGNRNYVIFPKAGIGGLPVSELGSTFSSSQLSGITVPDGVTNIAAGAFSDSGLRSVIMSTNVTSIGNNAFSSCGMENVTIPAGVVYIGDQAFAQNYLDHVVIPGSVKVLGNEAFNRNELSEVTLASGLSSIGDHAFANNSLGQIYIPNSVTNIGVGAFSQNSLTNAIIAASVSSLTTETFMNNSIESISWPAGLREIGDNAFSGNYFQTLIIPAGVTNIGAHAFEENSVYSLELPTSLLSIGDSAFAYDSLTSMVIPAGVTNIGNAAFYNNSINSVYFLGNAPADDAGTELSNNDSPIVYYLAGTTGWGSTYGDATTQMLPQPASGVTNANNTLTVTRFIGAGSVVVPTTVGGLPVTVIGTGAFATTGRLINSITLQNGVTQISFEAFTSCPALTTIVISDTVTNIDIDAFAGCAGLTNIIVSPGNPYFSSVGGVLMDKNQTTLLACGGGMTGTYVVPSTVTVIGPDAFMDCSGLTNIVLPAGVTSIGDPAFAFCDNLTTLTIPATVTDLGAYCFAYCSRLTTIYFEGDAPPDDGTAFLGDTNATIYYRASAVGFGSTFGGVPAVPLKSPVATPLTVSRPIGSGVQISVATLASHWSDPNQANPITLESVGSTSSNSAPVITNLTSILYTNSNNVADRIVYTIVDGRNMTAVGVINIVPTGIGVNGSGLTNLSLDWLGPQSTQNLAAVFADGEYGSAGLTYSVPANNNSSLVASILNGSTLRLAPLYNRNGSAQITVRADDPGGRHVDSTFTVTVRGILLAGSISAQRVGTNSVSVPISKLLSIASVPYAGDAASLTSFDSTTAQGGSVTSNSGSLVYHPPANANNDAFTYTISDNHGETAFGTVLISYKADTAISVNQPALTVTPTARSLRFNGIPGQHYEVQAAGSITGPWAGLSGTLTAAANGLISFDDTETPAPPIRFYRLVALP